MKDITDGDVADYLSGIKYTDTRSKIVDQITVETEEIKKPHSDFNEREIIMQFKIINPKPMNKNTLRGFFTLAVGPLEIEGYSYHVKADKSWVNPPSKEYFDKESGEKKYAPIVRIPDKDRYWAFQDWAISEAKELLAAAPEASEATAEGEDIPF